MLYTRLLAALALLGFVSIVLGSAVAPLPSATQIAEQPPSVTSALNSSLPDTSGARGFDLGAADDPYALDGRAERLLDR
jgi:hypothetical protein